MKAITADGFLPFEQTISEDEYLLSQAKVITGQCEQWDDDWQQLEAVKLTEFLESLENLNGPEAESGWLVLVRDRERLLDRRVGLAIKATKLELELSESTMVLWREGMVRFNEHRLFAAMAEAGVENEPLARQINKKTGL